MQQLWRAPRNPAETIAPDNFFSSPRHADLRLWNIEDYRLKVPQVKCDASKAWRVRDDGADSKNDATADVASCKLIRLYIVNGLKSIMHDT